MADVISAERCCQAPGEREAVVAASVAWTSTETNVPVESCEYDLATESKVSIMAAALVVTLGN
ncbi:MAG: hypothetical protein ACR2IE_16185 [Candidatus Sumerlaeaceae bacterium]